MKKLTLRFFAISIIILNCAIAINAQYTETIEIDAYTVNLKKDYNVSGKGEVNVSAQLQKAIDDVAKKGGGWVIIPAGKYIIAGIELKSNVHIKIDKSAAIYPHVNKGQQTIVLFIMGQGAARIKNTSIRGDGGKFTIVFGENIHRYKFLVCQNVENFLVENFHVQDAMSVYSSISLNPYLKDPANYSMPLNGTIRDGSIENALYGYGLIQAQAGKSIHFENLHGVGGCTLRLETGSKEMNDKEYGGLWDITANNISCKDGHVAVMLGPHSINSGVARIENVRTEGCAFAVKAGKGHIAKKQENPNLKEGHFAKGSYVKNIHAVFGTNAQLKTKDVRFVPEENLKYLRKQDMNIERSGVGRGPSISAVMRNAEQVEIQNVSYEGFVKHPPVISDQDAQIEDPWGWMRENGLVEDENTPDKWTLEHVDTYKNK